MSSLRDVQLGCYRAFSSPDGRVPAGELLDEGIPLATRISVYRNNASETFRKTLASTYPVVEKLVGDQCFRSLAQEFSRGYPSVSGDLQGFGGPFPAFMADQYDDSEYGYLGDIARLELAIEKALLLPDSQAIGIEALIGISEASLPDSSLVTVPSLQLLQSRYPVLEIWRANQPGDERSVDLAQGGQRLAILRRGGEVEIHPLDAATYALVAELDEGKTFGQAFDAIADEPGADLGRSLRVLFDKGCIAKLVPGA